MNFEQNATATYEALTNAMISGNPELGQFHEVMLEFMKEFMSWKTLKPEYTRIYKEAFTEAELRELAAFYRTPAGRKSVDVMPKLMQQGAAIGQKVIQEHLPELERRLKARMQ